MDRFYTPPEVAIRIAKMATILSDNQVIVDPTCGIGNLLKGVSSSYRGISCYGLERDIDVVRKIRRSHPDWVVSRGDFMNNGSFLRTKIFKKKRFDVVVANPPFSLNGRKYVEFMWAGRTIRCSPAMAAILRSAFMLQPKVGLVSIVPDSLLHSHTDEYARSILFGEFAFRVIDRLTSSTFSGTRVRASILELAAGQSQISSNFYDSVESQVSISLVRGGVPVHLSVKTGSTPFVHTTDIHALADPMHELRKTVRSSRGVIQGYAILLPRVGNPKPWHLTVSKFDRAIQLSDCVIALCSSSLKVMQEISLRVNRDWHLFTEIYSGTGAPYVTINKLESWLGARGVKVEVVASYR